jgi:hypothetical protein
MACADIIAGVESDIAASDPSEATRQAITPPWAHRPLDGIHAIGVDESAWKRTQAPHARLPARPRTSAAAADGSRQDGRVVPRFVDMPGHERTQAIAFVAGDTWKAFLRMVQVVWPGPATRRGSSGVQRAETTIDGLPVGGVVRLRHGVLTRAGMKTWSGVISLRIQ